MEAWAQGIVDRLFMNDTQHDFDKFTPRKYRVSENIFFVAP